VPYLRRDDDETEYPTSGEGRKKLLAYSVYSILSDDTADKMINIFRIEEPETNLHRAMQSALSHFLFDIDANDNKLKYLFISTHSPYILSDMDDVNLVRIFNENKITSKSEFYSVPTEWKNVKKKLNRTLSEAIFADAVLLVEGESECILFERVLSEIDPYYESKGNYILSVEGIGFKPYIDIFKTLEIKYVLKTDNDMKKVKDSNPALYYPLGLERINGILKFINVTDCVVLPVNKNLSEANLTIKARRLLYDKNKDSLDKIREKFNIYLSHCSLEEDILECLRNQRFIELLNKNTSEEALKYLKSKKQHRMVELVGKLNPDDCKKIYDHYNFACLKAVCV
jgi:putative ATP-dependent endonuclease of OLD family